MIDIVARSISIGGDVLHPVKPMQIADASALLGMGRKTTRHMSIEAIFDDLRRWLDRRDVRMRCRGDFRSRAWRRVQ